MCVRKPRCCFFGFPGSLLVTTVVVLCGNKKTLNGGWIVFVGRMGSRIVMSVNVVSNGMMQLKYRLTVSENLQEKSLQRTGGFR